MFEVVLFDLNQKPIDSVMMTYSDYYNALEFAEDMYNKYDGFISGYEINEYETI